MAKTNRSTATRFFLPQQHLEWEIRCNVQLSSRWVVGFLCSQNSPTGSFSLLRDGKSPNSPTIRLNMTCHHRSLQKKPDPTQFWVRGFVWGPSKGSCAHHNFHPFDLFWLPKAMPVLTTSKLTSLWHGLTTHQVHSQEPTLRGRKTPRRKWQNPWNFDVSWDAPSTSNDHYKAGLRGECFRRSLSMIE